MTANETPNDPRSINDASDDPLLGPPPMTLDQELSMEPVFAPWDGRRVPVTLLSGYLGSGKTTVINELLARTDRPIAVLVNDVGDVNIDARLIERQSSDTIELTDGCVCCSMINGFVEAFDQLRQREIAPDHVIVELSGVAEPARAAPWANTIGFALDGIVTLVDVDQFAEREADRYVGDVVRNQVSAADLVVLTKMDLVKDAAITDAVRQRVAELNPDAPVVERARADAIAGLLNLGTRRPGGVSELPDPVLFDVHDTTSVIVPNPTTEADLEALVADLPADTLRAKGVFALDDGRRMLVQVVGRRRSIDRLPEAEFQEPTPLVVIRPANYG